MYKIIISVFFSNGIILFEFIIEQKLQYIDYYIHF